MSIVYITVLDRGGNSSVSSRDHLALIMTSVSFSPQQGWVVETTPGFNQWF